MNISKYALNQDNIKISFMNKLVTPDSTNKIHCHPYHELVIKEKGCVRYTTNNEITDVKEKCVIFMPAHSIHNPFVQEKEIYVRYKIEFDFNFIKNHIKGGKELSGLISVPYIKTLSEYDFEEINILARGLFDLKNKEKLTDTDRLYECMHLILILQKCKVAADMKTEQNENYISEVTDFIKNNFTKHLTIEKIADRFYVSKSKLIYDFKKYCNMNILEYITMTKVNYAKECLLKGKSVAETAEMCGFSSPGYLIKVFSSVTDITPLKFRQTHLVGTKKF